MDADQNSKPTQPADLGASGSGQDQNQNQNPPEVAVPVQPIEPAPPQAQAEALKEPVQIPKSPVAIILRIVGLLTIMDIGFLLLIGFFVFLNVTNGILLLAFIAFEVFKIGSLIFLVMVALLPWANSGFYLTETQLIRKSLKKDITTDEVTYELRNIEGVRLHQGIIGRMFDYGDIHLRMMTDNPKHVVIRDVKDPNHYKSVFDKYISVNL